MISILTHAPGDKVRVRKGEFAGQRGLLETVSETHLVVILTDTSFGVTTLSPDMVTNYSLAARRAWNTMPKRSGRPRLSAPKKHAATFRLDIDVCQMLAEAAEFKLLSTRDAFVNDCLRGQLQLLLADHRRVSARSSAGLLVEDK